MFAVVAAGRYGDRVRVDLFVRRGAIRGPPGIVIGLMGLVGRWPWIMWPLQGTALGVIAGVTAWATDEPAASVVDTLPRPPWWRTAARATVVPLMLAVWVGCLLVTRHRLHGLPARAVVVRGGRRVRRLVRRAAHRVSGPPGM